MSTINNRELYTSVIDVTKLSENPPDANILRKMLTNETNPVTLVIKSRRCIQS